MRTWRELNQGSDLPCRAVAPALARLYSDAATPLRAVVTAPPGSGKTTLIPAMLAELEEAAGRSGTIIVCQPRRVAARAAAHRLAQLLGERVGERVGYAVRGDTQAGRNTRVLMVTSGVLVARLLADPELAGVSAVVIDEVHERSLVTDVALAFSLDVADMRDDLGLVAMSATTDAQRLSALISSAHAPATHLDAPGELHPVEVSYAPGPQPLDGRGVSRDFLAHVADIAAAHASQSGSTLVFAPAIRDVDAVCQHLARLTDTPVYPLHSRIPARAQDAAISGPHRRIVVATSVAETGVTVQGVDVVIDSVLSRQPRFDAQREVAGLVTVLASQAAITQRAGRAGRQGPGRVVRCVDETTVARLRAYDPPESATADLTDTAVALTAWGDPQARFTRLLDPFPPAAWEHAHRVAAELGLVADGELTPAGRYVAELPVDMRWAAAALRLLPRLGAARTARLVACLAEAERHDDARTLPPAATTLTRRIERALRQIPAGLGGGADGAANGAAMAATNGATLDDDAATALLIASAHPGLIARQRSRPGVYLTASGIGPQVQEHSSLFGAAWLAIAQVQSVGGRDLIRLAAPLPVGAVEHLRRRAEVTSEHRWDHGRVLATRVHRLGAIELHREGIPPERGKAHEVAVQALRECGWDALPARPERLLARLAFAHRTQPDQWPDFSDAAVRANPELLPTTLSALAAGRGAGAEDMRADVVAALYTRNPRWQELLPTHLPVPSGREVRVDYSGAQPALAVKLQECFSMQTSPHILGVPVVIELLAPNGATAARTADLASFWAGPYQQVRADMRGRYPKHPWPADPTTAPPTHLTNVQLRRRDAQTP